jgi:hypothetical protein
MSNAHENDVMRHFVDGRKPRLDLPMLPRDVNRVTGTLRKVLCTSFNYVKKYPVKLEKYIEVLKYAVNFALAYQHHEMESKKVMEEKVVAQRLINNDSEV